MRYAFTVIDDFLPEPDALRLRAQAMEADYQPFCGSYGTSEETPVGHIAVVELAGVHARIQEAVNRHVIAKWTGFRLDYASETPSLPVHFDTELGGDYAAVLYLNLPSQCAGGTAFWRHGASALGLLPANASPETEAKYRADGADPGLWICESVVAMAWNRLLVYPTDYFHSRLPFAGFGSTPSDGRMIAGAFFDTETSADFNLMRN